MAAIATQTIEAPTAGLEQVKYAFRTSLDRTYTDLQVELRLQMRYRQGFLRCFVVFLMKFANLSYLS